MCDVVLCLRHIKHASVVRKRPATDVHRLWRADGDRRYAARSFRASGAYTQNRILPRLCVRIRPTRSNICTYRIAAGSPMPKGFANLDTDIAPLFCKCASIRRCRSVPRTSNISSAFFRLSPRVYVRRRSSLPRCSSIMRRSARSLRSRTRLTLALFQYFIFFVKYRDPGRVMQCRRCG